MWLETGWVPLATKVFSTALVVIVSSAAAERSGPFWGAVISTLPVSAGPAYVMLALESQPQFIASGALNSFAALYANMLFLVVIAWMVRSYHIFACVAAALLLWFLAAWVTASMTWTVAGAVWLNLSVFLISLGATARIWRNSPPSTKVPNRWSDLLVRGGAVAAIVVGVVSFSAAAGPAATGIAAMFPVSLMILVVVVRRRLGAVAAAVAAVSAIRTLPGLGLFLLILHLTILKWDAAAALTAALAGSLAWSGGIILWRSRYRRSPGAISVECSSDSTVKSAGRCVAT
jgi:hypothetical protein